MAACHVAGGTCLHIKAPPKVGTTLGLEATPNVHNPGPRSRPKTGKAKRNEGEAPKVLFCFPKDHERIAREPLLPFFKRASRSPGPLVCHPCFTSCLLWLALGSSSPPASGAPSDLLGHTSGVGLESPLERAHCVTTGAIFPSRTDPAGTSLLAPIYTPDPATPEKFEPQTHPFLIWKDPNGKHISFPHFLHPLHFILHYPSSCLTPLIITALPVTSCVLPTRSTA